MNVGKFTKNQQEKNERTEERVRELLAEKERIQERPQIILQAEIEVAAATQTALESRQLLMTSGKALFILIDIDCFYAQVEMRDRPELADKPVAIGGNHMLCTANYPARKFGVRSAMPGFMGLKLCPQLIIIKPNFDKYCAVSKEFLAIFRTFDPHCSMMSLDEGYLNVSGFAARTGLSGSQIASEIRRTVKEKLGLTCSAGIAATPMLAKICSEQNKPDGQFELAPDSEGEIDAFLEALPVSKINGIGKVTAKLLHGVLGVETVRDLRRQCTWVKLLFSELSFSHFLELSYGGFCEREILDWEGFKASLEMRKSISHQRTFLETSDMQVLLSRTAEACQSVALEMEENGYVGKTLTLLMKLDSFKILQKSVSFAVHTRNERTIADAASLLLKQEMPKTLRLLGVKMSNLQQSKQDTGGGGDIRQLLSDAGHACGGSSAGIKRIRADCPVCNRSLEGSEFEIGLHVESCLVRAADDAMASSAPESSRVDARDGLVGCSPPVKRVCRSVSTPTIDRFFPKK